MPFTRISVPDRIRFDTPDPIVLALRCPSGRHFCSESPDRTAALFDLVRDNWASARRDGAPLLIAEIHVALGRRRIVDSARARL
ncbi:hypothetical protein AB0878_40060 [Amycolatopsis sp. NPDC047767]|uniref:hypothetical protein n=1 Tax=Amycolatopsis sp. NPDC047767 TaxID=3156765 RepID=UPI0034543F4F